MGSNIRLILMIVSLIVTTILLAHHIYLFVKYLKRGKYHYESFDVETYVVVKEGYSKLNCPLNGTTFTDGEIDWLVIRSKGHYLFLFWFWGALILSFLTSIFGSILEYIFKSDINCCSKFFRLLRSIVYKSSISVPVTVLFAFDYAKECLQLKQTTFMLFSNTFTYLTVVIQFPLLLVILLDVLYELYIWKPNATYMLVKTSIKDQPTCTKVLRILLYSVLFLVLFVDMLLSFLIYLELLFIVEITHLLLVSTNILLSVINICFT